MPPPDRRSRGAATRRSGSAARSLQKAAERGLKDERPTGDLSTGANRQRHGGTRRAFSPRCKHRSGRGFQFGIMKRKFFLTQCVYVCIFVYVGVMVHHTIKRGCFDAYTRINDTTGTCAAVPCKIRLKKRFIGGLFFCTLWRRATP